MQLLLLAVVLAYHPLSISHLDDSWPFGFGSLYVYSLFQSSSTLDNIDEWRWKLTMLLRNNDEQEVVSREKKDRRDFEHLSALATRMGLHRYFNVILFF